MGGEEAQVLRHPPSALCSMRSYKKIHLHHSSHERLTREPDSDPWPLCFNCHRNVHRAKETGRFGDLAAATIFIVERGQARLTPFDHPEAEQRPAGPSSPAIKPKINNTVADAHLTMIIPGLTKRQRLDRTVRATC